MTFTEIVGIWLAALFTLMIYSILYKENVLYRFAEHTAIGTGVGYTAITTLKALRGSLWIPLTNGNLLLIIPLIIGIMMYFRFIQKYSWVSLWSTAVLTGLGIGLALYGAIHAQFIQQIEATIVPLFTGQNTFDNLITLVTTVFVLYYFLFTVNFKSESLRKGSENIRTMARYFLMIALGTTFAGATMTWIVNIIMRVQFLLFDWLHI